MKAIVIPDYVTSLPVYIPGRPIEEVERELGLSGTAKLASNENPLGASPRALEAARGALPGVNRYPDGGGFYLKAALAERLAVPADQIVLGNGSTEIVELLAKTFIGRTGNAVISEGAFVMYRIAVTSVGGGCRLAPMTADLRHNLPAMAGAIDPDTRLVYIANPNNPTGTYVSEAEVAAFLEKVPEDVVVVVDEAYREYISAPDYPDSMTHLRAGRPLVILRTFSKIYGLAGLRIGYALTRPDIAAHLERVRSPFNTSSVAQAAALAALDDAGWVDSSRRSNAAGLRQLEEGLKTLGIPYTPSVANFVLLHPPGDSRLLYELVMRQGIIMRPMGAFGFPRSIRVSVGTEGENRRVLAALSACLSEARAISS